MLPVALLAFMGILLGLGSSFSSESMIKTVKIISGKPAVKIIFQFMSTIGGFAFASTCHVCNGHSVGVSSERKRNCCVFRFRRLYGDEFSD